MPGGTRAGGAKCEGDREFALRAAARSESTRQVERRTSNRHTRWQDHSERRPQFASKSRASANHHTGQVVTC